MAKHWPLMSSQRRVRDNLPATLCFKVRADSGYVVANSHPLAAVSKGKAATIALRSGQDCSGAVMRRIRCRR